MRPVACRITPVYLPLGPAVFRSRTQHKVRQMEVAFKEGRKYPGVHGYRVCCKSRWFDPVKYGRHGIQRRKILSVASITVKQGTEGNTSDARRWMKEHGDVPGSRSDTVNLKRLHKHSIRRTGGVRPQAIDVSYSLFSAAIGNHVRYDLVA